MGSLREYILLEYAGTPEGTVLSGQMCPSCHGGRGGESSMSVGNTNGLLWWRCHRNSCSFRGAHGAFPNRQAQPAQHNRGRWNYETQPLPSDWLDWLECRFSTNRELIDREWKWTDSYGGRVVMPVRNDRGVITAYNLRSYDEDNTPKSLLHRVMEEAGQAWYRSSPYASRVVVVEDQPSALRASTIQGVDAIALLGTDFPESLADRLRFVYRHRHKVLLALDQDATQKAVEHVVRWKHALPSLEVLPLEVDIKDHDEEQFIELIRRIKQDGEATAGSIPTVS